MKLHIMEPQLYGKQFKQGMYLFTAVVLMLVTLKSNFPPSLSPTGHAMISVLVFAMVLWVTEAVGFSESCIYLIAAMSFVVAFTPDPADPGKLIGLKQGLNMALSGLNSDAWIMVMAAFFIAAAVNITKLGQRIGLTVLHIIGSGPKQILISVLVMSYTMMFFIPSPTGIAALIMAVLMDLTAACGIDRRSNLAKGMMLAMAYGTATGSIGLLTSNAPAIQTAAFVAEATKQEISWLQWFIYGEPFGILLALVLYALIVFLFPPEKGDEEPRRNLIKAKLAALGPLTGEEKRLLAILTLAIGLWASGGTVHQINNSAVSIMVVAAIMMPGVGVGSWKSLSLHVDWGILMLYGTSVSLGQWLLKSEAAGWMADNTLAAMGVQNLPFFLLILTTGLLFGLFALFFSARAAAAAAIIPTAIGFIQGVEGLQIHPWGYAVMCYYLIQTVAILPMHHPMAMLAYSTETFTPREMVKIGVPFMIIELILLAVMASTYWKWTGLL